ncbi:MAG: nuclear transport factor 2 family protein [Corynebacteriales bacterium]|nr:nuclear transport factor 2 family protein [Mycobacteriales bacterium]
MNIYDTAIARYLTAWNATSTAECEEAVAAAWTPEGSYTDPLADVAGHQALVQLITAVQGQFPGFTFRLVGTPDGHHNIARFSWELVAPDGTAPVAGSDVIKLDAAGKITEVHGFLDRVPSEV